MAHSVSSARKKNDHSSTTSEVASLAQASFQLSPDLLVITDLAGNVLESNQAWRTSLGINPTSMIGKSWSAIVNFLKMSSLDPQVANASQASHMIAFSSRDKKAIWFAWTRTRLEDQRAVLWTGHEKSFDTDVHLSPVQAASSEIPENLPAPAAPAMDSSTKFASSNGTESEIAQSIRTEMLGDTATIPIRQVIEHMPGILFELHAKNDGSFRFVYVTENSRNLFQMTPDEVYARDPSGLFFGRDFPGLLIELFDSATTLRSVSWEGRLQRGDLTGYWVKLFATPMNDTNGSTVWYGLMLDIHQQRMAEAALTLERAKAFGAAKMAALGEMTAGVAHEINNPLAVILGKVERLGEMATADEEFDRAQVTDSVAKIVKMTHRISKIIKSLRSFARDAESDPFELRSLSQIVEDSVELCNARFRSANVQLKVEPIASDILLECRAVQISQVLLNLLNNSFDAIHTRQLKWVSLRCEKVEDQISIIVTDCGTGIPLEVAAHIMAPFFTTKPAGRGTGLGLSISRDIIETHGGTLTVDHEQANTTFLIHLPVQQKNSAANRAR